MRTKLCLGITFLIVFLISPFPAVADEERRLESGGRLPLNEKEQTAVAAAMSGTVVTRNLKSIMIEAVPEGADSSGCISVRVVSVSPALKEINHYGICSGLITNDTHRDEFRQQEALDGFVLEISRKAGKHGMAQGIFEDYTVKAFALRQGNSCSVETQLFRDGSLLKKARHPCD